MTTSQIIALGFPVAAAAGAAAFLVKRFWLRNPEPAPIDPAQIDIAVAMSNIQEAMKEIERANLAARQKTAV
jgi:LEA14-like dessication related protein